MIDKKFCVALVECGEWKVILMQLEKAISIKSVYMVKSKMWNWIFSWKLHSDTVQKNVHFQWEKNAFGDWNDFVASS